MWLNRLYQNHVFATLAYLLVLALGLLAYPQLPREKAPQVNGNAVYFTVAWPGASADDAERLLLNPVERMLRTKIKDISRSSTGAGRGRAYIQIFFKDIARPVYERRVQELRRELQALAQAEFPQGARVSDLFEENSLEPDWFKVLVYGPGNDEHFRQQARQVQRDLQRLPGVSQVFTKGLEDPELHVLFHPERLAGLGIDPGALADTVQAYFRDIAAGPVKVGGREWLVHLSGTEDAAATLAALPILAAQGTVKLGELADITRTSQAGRFGARFRGQPAVAVMLFKQPGANALQLIDQIKTYIDTRNRVGTTTGVQLFLLLDTSDGIRQALDVMEHHAWSGIVLVLMVTWLMLGTRLAFLTTLAVPFSLAGVFIALQATGQSLNLSVLLGVVIALGMLVDDAVVVIEAIGQHIRRGMLPLPATVAALREVWLPVATSSLTTIASFLPLMLMSGFLGNLMGVVPQVVGLALLISLVQALWILPAQAAVVITATPIASWRDRFRHRLQQRYAALLIRVIRAPTRSLLTVLALFALAGTALTFGWVRVNFFPEEPSFGFSVSLTMPTGTVTEQTLAKLEEIEQRVTPLFKPGELRASAIESGEILVGGRQLDGSQVGDVWFDMHFEASRDTKTLTPQIKAALVNLTGTVDVWVERARASQAQKPINLQLSGARGAELDAAVAELKGILGGIPAVHDIQVDLTEGLPELNLRLDSEAVQRAGLSPASVIRIVQLLAGGERVASFLDQDEVVGVRVRADEGHAQDITAMLRHAVARADGSTVPISQLVVTEQRTTPGLIYHENFKRILLLQADLDKDSLDTLAVNALIKARWDAVRDRYPNIEVELGGETEAIYEGLRQLGQQFVLGIGLIALIVGAQFRSYMLPVLVLLKVPMAFTGLLLGLLLSREPMSLYTLYGAVALAGIAVNSAILMFSAAQDRLAAGMGVVHAAVSAARRRMLPILITSLTTLVGLLPLALGGDVSSTQWRPVATAIVWGVGFSTILTLFIVPLLYCVAMGWATKRHRRLP